MTIAQFLPDLHPKQILRQTDRQTLNCQMGILLTMAPLEKEDLSSKYIYIYLYICTDVCIYI